MAKIFEAWIREGERLDFGVWGNVFESGCELVNFAERAIDEGEFGGFFQATLGGDGLSCASSGTEDEGVDLIGFDVERFLDGGDEAGTVSIVAEGFHFRKHHGVDCPEQLGLGGYHGAAGHGLEFMRNRDVAADEVEFTHEGEGLGEAAWGYLEADVRGVDSESVEGGLVEFG